VQNRNRRTGKRRTLQVAEVTSTGDAHVILQHNAQNDKIERISESKVVIDRLMLYTGLTKEEILFDIKQKMRILDWLVKRDIDNVDEIGLRMAKYYTGHLNLD